MKKNVKRRILPNLPWSFDLEDERLSSDYIKTLQTEMMAKALEPFFCNEPFKALRLSVVQTEARNLLRAMFIFSDYDDVLRNRLKLIQMTVESLPKHHRNILGDSADSFQELVQEYQKNLLDAHHQSQADTPMRSGKIEDE